MPSLPAIDLKARKMHSPHVVILGAGASLAACPRGDRNGRHIPLMKELVSVCELTELIKAQGLDPEISDFEAFYSAIHSSPGHSSLAAAIESKLYNYFSLLELPESATPYDYLVLSLQQKDLIATFNWDPLLVQAYRRNLSAGPLPKIAFLHGNVAIGACRNHERYGYLGTPCNICGLTLDPLKLLFPTTRKDYKSDRSIAFQWRMLMDHIEFCYYLTIFGYSAPKTDLDARELMQGAWNKNETASLAEVEIIDIKGEAELRDSWREFTAEYHYFTHDSFWDSWLVEFPRQTCEALYDATMQQQPRVPTPMPRTDSLEELQQFVCRLRPEPLKV